MTGKGRAALVIALVVVCSALVGAGADRMLATRFGRHHPPGLVGRSTPEQDAKRRTEMLDRMTKELDLSTAQRAGIDTVMRRTDSSLRAIRVEMQPRLRSVFESSRTEILARLDSTQRKKFEASRHGPRGGRGPRGEGSPFGAPPGAP